ncbi:CoA ester lyase [Nocardia colli]|uniref:CoA ester lyase n=1 Tax=Nocardia colli TaxID=2545717 RepID=A0A5N0DYL0_9NOCA|nr:CoA ester lyase [Nocardia colli]KAA8880631.1 CoA ester lyase [Nocardia colli]
MPPVRSWLYVPGDRPDRFDTAVHSGADAVVIDLEDAVTADRKPFAREATAAFLMRHNPSNVLVRINALDMGGRDDLAALARSRPAGIRVAKAEQPGQIEEVAAAAPEVPVWPVIESALGVEHALTLATCHRQVAGLLIGNVDLATDLRITDPEVIRAVGLRVLVAAAAAGLPRPPMSVYPDLRDLTGLAQDCIRGLAQGYWGRSVIHPSQIPVVNGIFIPDQTALRHAQAIVAQANAHGTGAQVDSTGVFVDGAVVRHARSVVDAAATELDAGRRDQPQ